MAGFEVFGDEERQAINDLFDANGCVLFAHGFDGVRNGIYKVREFEKAFAGRMDVPYAQAVSSCTAALLVALEAMGVGNGDEVIIPSFTFVATCEAVIRSGATPVIVDVDESLNMSPAACEAAITERTKCIIPVHMMGAPADLDAIMNIAKKHDLMVLEDTAQGCGGTWRGKPLGTVGTAGAYSFDAGKTMITGEGGMVVTRDENIFKRARAVQDHGHEYSGMPRGAEGALCEGFNFRMTEIQGAIGIVQLSKLDRIVEAQRANKQKLLDALKGLPYPFRTIHDEGELSDAVIFFLESAEKANTFAQGLYDAGLGTKNLPDAMRWHFAKHWGHLFERNGWYPDHETRWQASSDILERSIALSVNVQMSDEEIEKLAETCLKLAEKLEG